METKTCPQCRGLFVRRPETSPAQWAGRKMCSQRCVGMATQAKRRATTPQERITRSVSIDPQSGCWNWSKNVNMDGYGQTVVRGKTFRAHRLAYEAFVGPIGDLHVCHSCDNRRCCNPAHLWLGTNADNARDRQEKGRTSRGARHSKALIARQALSLTAGGETTP